MPKIFISYRRSDSQMVAGRLRESLARRFGDAAIFRDKDSIGGGEDWTRAIAEGLKGDVVVVALIGPGWSDARDEQGRRRLDDPADWNRVELEQALAREARVLPLLVENTAMPAEADLPESLQPMARLRALKLRDDDWEADIERVVHAIGALPAAGPRRGPVAAAVGVLALVVASVGAYLWLRSPAEPDRPTAGAPRTPPRGEAGTSGYREDIVKRLTKEQYDALAIASTDRPRAVALIDRNLAEVNAALAAFPEDATLHALAGYAAKNVFASSKGLLSPEQRAAYLLRSRNSFERALQLEPGNPGAVNGMGNVLFYERRFDDAIAHHRRALDLTSGNYPAAEHDLRLVQRVKRGELPFDP